MFCVNLQDRDQAKGFSLIEVMVGMTLGLLTALVIMQVFSVFENQKRTTTAGSDAQENGLMAIVQLEQDIRNAGTGLADSAALNCNAIFSYYESGGTTTIPAPGVPSSVMAPVTITDGGATGSDTITMTRGTEFLGSIPATITSTMPQTSSTLKVNRTTGFNGTNDRCSGCEGDLILVSQGGICTVMQVTNANAASLTLTFNNGVNAPYNPPGSFYNTAPGNTWPTFASGAKILNFGSLISNTYSVDANYSLQMVDKSAAVTTLVKDIVSLQAQYGISTAAGVQEVTSWVDATAASGFNTLDSDKVKRIKAVRITVVARSGKKEAGNVTTSAPGGVDISTLPDWQKYRYRVYTTIIPLRNIIWANV